MTQQSLQEQINNLKVLLQQKDEQIAQLRKDLNKVYLLSRYRNPNGLFIPENDEWVQISSLEARFDSENLKVRVISSSTYQNKSNWNPKHLFNGRLEIAEQNGWASETQLPAYLEIHFNKPIKATFLTITSDSNTSEAPASFEIYGGRDSFDFKKLGEFSTDTRQPLQEKKFSFNNEDEFTIYKVIFLKSVSSTCVSMTKLNLGGIDCNDINS